MLPDPASELWGALSLAALLLLPGLLVVRAPWTAVPFLSLSFWIASWWWLSLFASGRRRFVLASLAGFAALAALRLLKRGTAARPSLPVAIVAVAAVARCLPYALWPVAPGDDMSLHSTSALLMVWRDGMPASYEPFLPIHAFGAVSPGFQGLAADVSLLSGLPAFRAAFLVSVAAQALLTVAVFALLVRFVAPAAAAVTTLASLALAGIPAALFARGQNATVLALALVVSAAGLLSRGASRSRAFACGALLGAAVITDATAVVASIGLAPLVLQDLGAGTENRKRASVLVLAPLLALALAAPFLLRLGAAFSYGESGRASARVAVGGAVGLMDTASLEALAFLAAVAAGGGLLLWHRGGRRGVVLGVASAVLLMAHAGAAGGPGLGTVLAREPPLALLAILMAGGAGVLVQTLLEGPGWRWILLTVMLGVAVERAHHDHRRAAAEVALDANDTQEMTRLVSRTRPLDLICTDGSRAAPWVPAVAGRAADSLPRPALYFDEGRPETRPCASRYGVMDRREIDDNAKHPLTRRPGTSDGGFRNQP